MNFLNMVKFELKLMFKTPIMIITYFIYPVLLTTIIGYLTQDNFGGGFTSYEFYSISMMIFVFMGAGLSSAYNFMDKPFKDGNLRTIFTPLNTKGIYMSQVVSGSIFCTLGVGFSMLIFKNFFNISYKGSGFLVFLSFVALIFMSNAIGILLCTISDNLTVIGMLFNLVQVFFCMLGGAFFSIEALGKIPALLAKTSPIKWFMDGILNSIYDSNNFLIYISIVINIILGIIFLAICSRTFKTEKYL